MWRLVCLVLGLAVIACAPAAIVPQSSPALANTLEPATPPTVSLMALIPARGAYKHGLGITEEIDKFTGNRKVTLSPNPRAAIQTSVVNQKKINFLVVFSYPADAPAIPPSVDFLFVTASKDWQYLSCHNINLLLDDTVRFPMPEHHEGLVRDGYVLEYMGAAIPTADFLKIANASKIEGRVCNDEFLLTAEQTEALKDTASRLQP